MINLDYIDIGTEINYILTGIYGLKNYAEIEDGILGALHEKEEDNNKERIIK